MKRTVKASVGSNAVLNIIKQSCNILFPLITYPYVTRVLGEEGLGRFSFADSIVSYLLLFSALGIPTYAIREGARLRDDKKRITDFAAEIFTINTITALLAYFLLLMLILGQDRLQRESALLWILSINILTNTIGRDWINNIYEDFLYITLRYVFFQIISLVLIFLLIHSNQDVLVYTIIMMFANSGAYLTSCLYTMKRVPLKLTFRINAREHLKPILILFCSTIAIQIYGRADIVILGYLRSNAEVGIYTIAFKIYALIKALINAVIMVTIPRLSYYLENDYKSYNELLQKLKDSVITLVVPSILGCLCLSKEIISLVGGKGFESGHTPLSILCIALFFATMGCYYSQGIIIINRDEKTFLIATVVSAIVNIVLNIVFIPWLGMSAAAITTVLAEMLVYTICYIKASQFHHRDQCTGLISIISGCFVIVLVCFACKYLISGIIVRVGVACVFSVVLYSLILLIGQNPLATSAYNTIKKKLLS